MERRKFIKIDNTKLGLPILELITFGMKIFTYLHINKQIVFCNL